MTFMARKHRQIDRSATEKARLQTIRDRFQTDRPSLDELVDSGDYSEPVKHGTTLDAMHIASLLKQARTEAQLSLSEVAKRCGLDRSAISRLENGVYDNTSIHTLSRLAAAYGKRFRVELVDDNE
jgi:DNA-binding XRE family transcriptional regulator